MCSHLSEYISKHGLKSYQLVNSYFAASTSHEKRKRKALNCVCFCCRETNKLFSCLFCIYFACKTHLIEHFKNKKHYIGVNLDFGMPYCFICSDYIYDHKLLKINERNFLKATKSLKRSISFYPFFPSESEISEVACLKQHPKKLIAETNRLGLRGLFNLGSTCFMNCIIQVLTHTPVLRDFFLSDRHNCKLENCAVCEISKIFQEFYNGKSSPISLHDLLVLIWKNATHLAGTGQQDAHEFFIATLNLLHSHFRDNSKSQQQDPCNCIIDEIFTGFMQSNLVCTTCLNSRTIQEPFKDLSLDLSFDMAGAGTPKNLIHCLERFTRLEHLGANAKLTCSKCNAEREFTKELSIETLPIIASFHLKRFEQTGLNDKKKISTYIAFPDELDLTPFLTKSPDSDQTLNRASAKYSLYAVVNHEGRSIDVGHYTSFIRHAKNYWIKCDDLNLIPYSFEKVLNSEGYLLFYHKKILEYD